MLEKLKAAIAAFLATKTGHAVEHAVTAAAATAGSLLLNNYFKNGGHLTLNDVHAAWVAFVAGVIFGLRTLFRNRKVAKDRFKPGYKA